MKNDAKLTNPAFSIPILTLKISLFEYYYLSSKGYKALNALKTA